MRNQARQQIKELYITDGKCDIDRFHGLRKDDGRAQAVLPAEETGHGHG